MDISTASAFGITVAYLLPGIVNLSSLAFWFPSLGATVAAFVKGQEAASIAVALFAALVVGMELNLIRWVLFERWMFPRLAKDSADDFERPTPEDFTDLALASETGASALRDALEENFRYHQAYGDISLAGLLLFLGWLHSLPSSGSCFVLLLAVGVFILLEVITVSGAVEAYKRYVTKVRAGAEGVRNAKRWSKKEVSQ